MKIAFFVENIQFGGLDTFIINLLNNWQSDDELTLICNISHPGLSLLKNRLNKNINVIEHSILLVWDIKFHYPNMSAFMQKILKLFYFIIDIPIQVYLFKKLFLKYKFNKLMVINGGYPGGDSCLSASIAWGKLYPNNKAWHNFHNLAYVKDDYNGISKLKYYRSLAIDKILKKYVKGFVSVSKSSIDSLNIRTDFNNNHKIYIYNGIDIDENLNNIISIKEKYGIDGNAKVITMLGVYEERKGQEFLIKAFKEVYKKDKNIYLFMFGRGDENYVNYLKQIIGNNQNIYLEDYKEDIKQIYKDTDILAIPSQALESFGYTAVEAMGYKIPIIATNIGGLPEVVEDRKCGYIIEKDDIDEFSNKLQYLLENDNIRKSFGENGYKRYHEIFKADVMANTYEKLIKG